VSNRAVSNRAVSNRAVSNRAVSNKTCPIMRVQSSGVESLRVQSGYAPAYAPHCNPVERTNKTIKTMIAQYVEKDHRMWDEYLPALQFAFNTAVHDTTKYTPAFLNHGRAPIPSDRQEEAINPPDTVRDKLEEAYKLVRINLAKAFQR